MFTGLIEEVGNVIALRRVAGGGQLEISAPLIANGARKGDSIAINGCCLTIVMQKNERLAFDLVNETLARTNLGGMRENDPVNLERALAANARLGGHFVQGHIDCTGRIETFSENDERLEITVPHDQMRYLAEKGSVAVNGISLTIAEVRGSSFVSSIIPHTRAHTNLKSARAGDIVNIEFDILAKYVERLLPATQ